MYRSPESEALLLFTVHRSRCTVHVSPISAFGLLHLQPAGNVLEHWSAVYTSGPTLIATSTT